MMYSLNKVTKSLQLLKYFRANSEPLLRNQNNSNTDSSSPPLYEATSCSTSDNYQNSQLQEINVQQTCGMYNPKFEHVNEYSEGSVLDFKIHPNQSDVKSCPNESHCWTCISNSKNSSNTECAKFMNHAQISCDEPGVETVLPKNAYALYSNMQVMLHYYSFFFK